MAETTAVLIAGDVARAERDSGARQRLETLAAVAEQVCTNVMVLGPGEWTRAPAKITLAIGQSWPTLRALKRIAAQSSVVWFDACDSTYALRKSNARTRPTSSLIALIRDRTLSRTLHPDMVTYITEADALRDQELWSVKPLVLPIRWTRHVPRARDGPRRIVLSGDGTYQPNHAAAAWALNSFVPALRSIGIPNSLWIYGQGFDLPTAPGVHLAGYEPDAGALYQRGDIHIGPITTGAGMNSKVALPLLAGLDVVTTPLGIEGLTPTSRTTVCELEEFPSVVAKQIVMPVVNPLNPSLRQILRRDDTPKLLKQLRRLTALARDTYD